jgi:Rab3 GTPase-activating protein catalytic subunit
LLARIALHALVLGNPRAVAVLWRRLVREIRFAHWDRGVVLPRVGGFGCEQRAARRRRGKFPQKNSGAKKTEDSNNSSDDETEDDTAAKVFMDEQVDQNACLLHQKIQLINACIRRRGVNSENERKASDAAREKAIALKARIAEQSVTKKSSTNASVGWEDELGGWDVFDKHTRDTTTPTVRSVDDDIDLVALLGETSGYVSWLSQIPPPCSPIVRP